MCAIYGCIGTLEESYFYPYFMKLQHRGPDNTQHKQVTPSVWFGFHRLAINGLDEKSNQPFHNKKCWLIANGEIYNFKELKNKYSFDYKSNSDCEIILHLYERFGIEKTLSLLDGEFSFILYDEIKEEIFVARDHLGVRPLYFGKTETNDILFSSEEKGISFCKNIDQFPTGSWWTSKNSEKFHSYFSFKTEINNFITEEEATKNIRTLIFNAVKKRMMSDRKVGCLLSGGLDSSLVAGITATFYENKKDLHTFSIGFKGSPDLKNAKVVADFIGSTHHSVEVSEKMFLDAIETVIYQIGSFDITTIRASVGHYLISQWVRENSEVKVLLSGETADEMAGGYLYFQNAPNEKSFHDESIRLLQDIHYFDMLRGDRSISSAGLEARVPFSDKYLVKYYLSIPVHLRTISKERMEKYLIRKAFEDDNLIPEEVLWRRKNGFSDGVSALERSWHTIVQEYVDSKISDEEFEKNKGKWSHDTPQIKEGYFYRKIFEKQYQNQNTLTPYQWLPKWSGDIIDPSARALSIYESD